MGSRIKEKPTAYFLQGLHSQLWSVQRNTWCGTSRWNLLLFDMNCGALLFAPLQTSFFLLLVGCNLTMEGTNGSIVSLGFGPLPIRSQLNMIHQIDQERLLNGQIWQWTRHSTLYFYLNRQSQQSWSSGLELAGWFTSAGQYQATFVSWWICRSLWRKWRKFTEGFWGGLVWEFLLFNQPVNSPD
jgi:hypothetical protein